MSDKGMGYFPRGVLFDFLKYESLIFSIVGTMKLTNWF